MRQVLKLFLAKPDKPPVGYILEGAIDQAVMVEVATVIIHKSKMAQEFRGMRFPGLTESRQ
jgi:hypothetical protein